jgi:Arc/MetJ family transcription regulator
MKISLTLDDNLMAQAMARLDVGTHAEAVSTALLLVVRKHAYKKILESRGQLTWDGEDKVVVTQSIADETQTNSPRKKKYMTEWEFVGDAKE